VLPPEINPLPTVYTPHALLLVNDSDSGSGLSSLISSSGLGGLASMAGISAGGGGYGQLAVKLAVSKTVLDIITEEFGIVERYKINKSVVSNARKAIQEHLSVEYDEDTKTISISYEDYDPEFARDLVNRMVELLDSRFASIGGNRNRTQMSMLEEKLADVRAEMSRIEAEIQAFQTRHGVLDVQSLATEQVTVLAQLRSQLILKEMEIKTYSGFAQIEDPVLRRLRSERDNLLKLIKEMESGYSEYQGVIPVQNDLPALALEFEHLKRDLLVQGKIYELLTQQYEVTKLNAEGEGPIFQVLELAEAPDLKSGPSRGMICIVVTFAAFFMAVIGAFVINAVENIKKDPERMKKLRGEAKS
jgi:tyrosine-protein kinase Etk/Wzc